MNEKAKALGCKGTNFAVAHGMHHDRNYSTALDLAIITQDVIQSYPIFSEVVSTKRFECASRVHNNIYRWDNTNVLLWDPSKQYHGVKTGITQTAGPCLAVHFRSFCRTYDFIVVILNCKSREARFVEIPKLVEWATQKISRVKQYNYKPSLRR